MRAVKGLFVVSSLAAMMPSPAVPHPCAGHGRRIAHGVITGAHIWRNDVYVGAELVGSVDRIEKE
jgi:hypothetical protein